MGSADAGAAAGGAPAGTGTGAADGGIATTVAGCVGRADDGGSGRTAWVCSACVGAICRRIR